MWRPNPKNCLPAMIVFPLFASAVPVLAADAAPPFEYHGYLRSGVGMSRGGTDQTCFRAAGAAAKFRLGNECETYLEASFINNHPLTPRAGASYAATQLTFGGVSAGRHDNESTSPQSYDDGKGGKGLDQEFSLALREAFVQGIGILGQAKPWIGKRYYRRQDIHMLDYYLINNSGPGFGVEEIDLGFAHLQAAVTRNTASSHDDTPAQVNPDLRLTDIRVGGGAVDVLAIAGNAGNRGHATGTTSWEAQNGLQLGVIHKMAFSSGQNRVTLQYGQGLFGGDGASRSILLDNFGADGSRAIKAGDTQTASARQSSSSLRVAEEYVGSLSGQLSSAFALLYQSTDFGGYQEGGVKAPGKSELMVGVRPAWQFTPYWALAGEYGYTQVSKALKVDGQYQDATLHKVTLAPELTAAGYLTRPQLRLFATYATWNKESTGQTGGAVYNQGTTGFSTGAQFEAWW